MIDGIANGLSALGHKTLCLNDDIEDKKLSDVISFCDAFIQINNVRDETQQNFKCIFISWIQDVYSSDTKMTFEKTGGSQSEMISSISFVILKYLDLIYLL